MNISNGNRALDRNDTPEGTPLVPLVRKLVEGKELPDAILVMANVTERCVTHSHAATEAAKRAEKEAQKARAATETLAAHLTQHRADMTSEVDQLRLSALHSFSRVYEELDLIKAELKLQREDIKAELSSSAKWSRVLAGAAVIFGLVAMELLK